MKKQLIYLVLMTFGGVGMFSCSQNHLAQSKEYDDLYYTSADRKAAIEAQPIAHRGSTSGYSDQNFRKDGELVYNEENFSARKVNPEYVSRYSISEDDNIAEAEVQDQEYFVEDYDRQHQNQGTAQNVRINNYYGRGFNNFGYSPFYDPFMMGGMGMMGMGFYDPFMWDPFWGPRFMRPGFSMRFGMGFGFGNAWGMGMYDPFWGSPWGMGMGMGMYDPFWGGGFYSPWGMGMGMNSYMMGYNRGFHSGMAFNRYYLDGNSPIRNTRTVATGPRMSRSNIAGTTSPVRSRSLARTADNTRTVATRTNARQASDLQSNYYSRSRRDVTEQSVSRSAAASNRSNIDGAAYSRNAEARSGANQRTYDQRRATPAGTDYNRSTAPARSPQYRTSPSAGSDYRSGTPSRSTQPQYRSAPSTQPSRSTQPQYRSTPSASPSRSSSPQYRSAPSSAPSRGGGSLSPSSAPSRSSSPAPSGGGGGSRRGN